MLLPVFSGIAAIEGVIVLLFMLKIPSMQKNSFLLGYSAMRMSLAGLILAGVLFFGFVSVRTLIDRKLREKINQEVEKFYSAPERFMSTILILSSSIVLPILTICFFSTTQSDALVTTTPLFQRFLPALVWYILIASHTLLYLLLTFHRKPSSEKPASYGWRVTQPLIVWTLLVITAMYFIDQVVDLGVSKEIGFHYWPFMIIMLLAISLTVLQIKYRGKAWFSKAIFYIASILVFFSFYFIYISTAEYVNYIHTPSKAYFPELAHAFLNGRLYLEDPSATMDLTFHNGEWYVAFPPLAAILMLPLVARFGTYGFSTVIFTITFASISVALVYMLLETLSRLGWTKLRTRDNLWLVILFGLGSIHWYMSIAGKVWYISRILTVTFITLAVLLTVMKKSPVWIGLAMGLAMGARPNIIFTWPFLLSIYMQHEKEKAGLNFKNVFVWSLMTAVPITAAVAGLLWYNFIRFGDLLDFGYATMNAGGLAAIQKYGQFNPSFIAWNVKYMLFQLPHRGISCNNRLVPDPQGISIFITTPALFYLVKSFRRAWWIIGAWLAIALQVSLLLMHTGVAWEFGYRFTMDFMIPMVVLLAVAAGERISWFMRILIIAGVMVNYFGVLWYFGLWCPA